jgi:hypothetical protein
MEMNLWYFPATVTGGPAPPPLGALQPCPNHRRRGPCNRRRPSLQSAPRARAPTTAAAGLATAAVLPCNQRHRRRELSWRRSGRPDAPPGSRRLDVILTTTASISRGQRREARGGGAGWANGRAKLCTATAAGVQGDGREAGQTESRETGGGAGRGREREA